MSGILSRKARRREDTTSPRIMGRTMREPSGSSAQKYSLSPTAVRNEAWLLVDAGSPPPPAPKGIKRLLNVDGGNEE
jgi:hypothetical protein